MKETQEETIKRLIAEAEKAGKALSDKEREELNNDLTITDLFNATVSGAITKMNTLSNLFSFTANMPKDTPEALIKYLSALLATLTREEFDGICDCLLTVTLIEPSVSERKSCFRKSHKKGKRGIKNKVTL